MEDTQEVEDTADVSVDPWQTVISNLQFTSHVTTLMDCVFEILNVCHLPTNFPHKQTSTLNGTNPGTF